MTCANRTEDAYFFAGCIVAVLFTAPVLNLAALVIGVAAMVHLHCVMVLGRAGAA